MGRCLPHDLAWCASQGNNERKWHNPWKLPPTLTYFQQESQLFLLLLQMHAGWPPLLLDLCEFRLQGRLSTTVGREQELLAGLHGEDVAALLTQEHLLFELKGTRAFYFLSLSTSVPHYECIQLTLCVRTHRSPSRIQQERGKWTKCKWLRIISAHCELCS